MLRFGSVAAPQVRIHFSPAEKQGFPNFVGGGEQAPLYVLVNGPGLQIKAPGERLFLAVVGPHNLYSPFPAFVSERKSSRISKTTLRGP